MSILVLKLTSRLSVASCIVLLVLCSLETLGQSRDRVAHEPLSSIPAHQRARLIERLNLLVVYQGTRQWDKMYDLSTASIRGEKDKEAFVEHRRKLEIDPSISTLLAFVPTEAIPIDEWQDGGAWELFGCAKYRQRGNIVQVKAGARAELRQGEWFFSEVSTATQIDGPEEACSIQPTQQTSQTAARSSSRCSAASDKRTKEGRQR